tara:strand:+ start:126 stop:359 length:234 start_codon:yes stop_codon:yes gene_type:complete
MKKKSLYLRENEIITIRSGFMGECEMTMTSEDWYEVIVKIKSEIHKKSGYKEYARWKKSNLPSDKWYVSQDTREWEE